MDKNEVNSIIKDQKIESVALNFVDCLGKLYSLYVHPSELEVAVEDGAGMSGWPYFTEVEKSDVLLRADLNSFRVYPWELGGRKAAGVMCDIYQPDKDMELEEAPRSLLKRAIAKLKNELGDEINMNAAPEMEFFILKKNENGEVDINDNASYFSAPPADTGYELRDEMVNALNQMGIKIVTHHHEAPSGKHEINIEYSNVLDIADKVHFLKMVVRKIANDKGLIATFMPKPFSFNWGAGHHTHMSLFNEGTGENIFYSPDSEYGLSDTCLHFIQGILKHAKGLVSVTNPTVNSYKRMLPESQAPMYISWSKFNRSTLIRIPASPPQATRVEYRPSDGSGTVYLSFAALIFAGLDGIAKKTFDAKPFNENVYALTKAERMKKGIEELPKNLGAALEELAKDEVIQDSLGTLYPKYNRIKEDEWLEYSYTVYEWERKKYLDDSNPMEYIKPVWRMFTK